MLRTFAVLLLLSVPTFAADRATIEANLATAVAVEGVKGKPLVQRMKELGIPAVSYAVIENGKVVLAAAVGEADIASGRDATPDTLFQAASISKPVAAMGVMELVERGKLSLDAPVNTLLRSWQLPENELTAKTPVTLRLLLSHSAGTTVHGFPGYAPDEPRPTLTQILGGTAPANTSAVVVDLAPNTKFRYSGGGTTIAQAVVEDQTGLPFPTFMRRTVLGPLGMDASTYEQPLPPSRRPAAATGYRIGPRVVDGKWHVYPEQAAAGLWTTPSDLAKVLLEIQTALSGRPGKVLSIDAARHMVTPRFAEGSDSIGIGFFIEKHGDALYFGHGGSNEGFRAYILGSVDGSRGLAFMANSDAADPLIDEMIQTVARAYQWPGFSNPPLQPVALTEADAARFAGRYEAPDFPVLHIRRADDRLELLDTLNGWQPLYPLADGSLARADRDRRYTLSEEGLVVVSGSQKTTARRLPADARVTGAELMAERRVDDAVAAYREQFRTNPTTVPQRTLNRLGYTYLFNNRVAEALALFQLNTELYPAAADTWDSYAYALITAGERERAVAAVHETLRRLESDTVTAPAMKERLKKNAESRLKRWGR